LELAPRHLLDVMARSVPRYLTASVARYLLNVVARSVPRCLTASVARWQEWRRAPSRERLSIGPQSPMAQAPLAVICREHSVFL